MGFWRSLFSAFDVRPMPPNESTLRFQKTMLLNMRKSVAITEAGVAWWADRIERFEGDIDSWNRLLPFAAYDAGADATVRRIIRQVTEFRRSSEAGHRNALKSLDDGIAALDSAAVELLVAKQVADALGYATSWLTLDDVDEASMRAQARQIYEKDLVTETKPDEWLFLHELLRRRAAAQAG